MKFPFIFKAIESSTTVTTTSFAAPTPWPWPTCVNSPKTLSFRSPNENMYKTINSDINEESFSYLSELPKTEHPENDDVILRGLKSERLFFEPGETSSILEEAKSHDLPFKETATMAMDSIDPFVDFRVSMEEMVEAHGLKDWECLEELLTCYLKVNEKCNHGFIVGAFVDLLLNLASANDTSNYDAIDGDYSSASNATNYSFTSPLSFFSSIDSSTSPSMENEDEIIIIEKNASSSCNFSSSAI